MANCPTCPKTGPFGPTILTRMVGITAKMAGSDCQNGSPVVRSVTIVAIVANGPVSIRSGVGFHAPTYATYG